MGVDTRGAVITGFKNVLLAAGLVQNALDGLIVAERRIKFPTKAIGHSKESREQFQTTSVSLNPDLGMLRFDFTFRGERRSLTLHMTCDSDHASLGPKSLSISIGCSGFSELFVKTALHALSLVGPAYFDANDCDNVDLAPLSEDRPTVFQAMQLGYIQKSMLPEWLVAYEEGLSPTICDGQSFFGVPLDQVRELASRRDYQSAWKDIKVLCLNLGGVPRFLEDYHQEEAEVEAAGALDANRSISP